MFHRLYPRLTRVSGGAQTSFVAPENLSDHREILQGGYLPLPVSQVSVCIHVFPDSHVVRTLKEFNEKVFSVLFFCFSRGDE